MYIKKIKKSNGSTAVYIVESIRRGKKVSQKILRSFGQHKDDKELSLVLKLAEEILIEMRKEKSGEVFDFIDKKEFFKSLKKKEEGSDKVSVNILNLRHEGKVKDGVEDIFGSLYEQLEFNNLIGTKKNTLEWNKILRYNVLSRIVAPCSKNKTSKVLKLEYSSDIPVEKIYRMMDKVYECEERIKSKIFSTSIDLFNTSMDIMLFDVTTLYFESFDSDGLREFGFSKDCKFKETQIVLALLTTSDGSPITYEVFPGNTSEGKTLISIIDKVKNKYKVKEVQLVADRAMFTSNNLKIMDDLGVKYVVAANLKKLKKKIRESILDDNYKPIIVNNDLNWHKELEINNRRFIVSYSVNRAKKDAKDRERLIERLLKKSKSGKISISSLISNYGTKKFIKVLESKASINYDKIKEESKWDGMHGVITNIEGDLASKLLSRYKDLWKIEEAFRINKSNLKMRPIFHWKPRRIKAHITICFIAYSLLCYMRKTLKLHNFDISIETLINELSRAESNIYIDKKNENFYSIPTRVNNIQSKIYKIFGLKRTEIPKLIS